MVGYLEYLRNHSFRKANIAIGFGVLTGLIEIALFGFDTSDTEQYVLTASMFLVTLVTLFGQYEVQYRRERRAEQRVRTGQRLAPTAAQPLDLPELEDVVARWPAAEGGRVE